MALKFEEYRGIENLVVAELIETIDENGQIVEEYGDVQPLSGVQQVSGEVNEASEAHYYDNMAAIVVDSEGEDTYTLVVSIPSKKTRALIEGTTYDEATGALIGTKKNKKYFALGFIANKLNGTDEYNWIYKGKFTGGNKTHDTKNDGTDATNMEYTFTSIHTSTKFNKGGNCKYLSVDNDGKANLSTFFDTVTTPDTLQAATPRTLTITQAQGTTLVVKKNGVSLNTGATIYDGDELTITVTGGTVKVNNETFTSGNTYTVSGNTTVVSTAQA